MANINQQWKRFTVVSCSHGHLADPVALKTVLKFNERWKPHHRIHLGDYIDTASFRTGARGTTDETVSLESDLSAATIFLRDYRPTVLLNGNHDIRLWKNANHHNAIIAECAQSLIREIRRALPKDCHFVETYRVGKWSTLSHFRLGDATLLHGWKYNVNAVRDTSRSYGKTIQGHLHRVVRQPADRPDGAVGYCVGYLGDEEKFEYADTQHSKMEWQNGFGWGEYTDTCCHINLCERTGQEWRLPL